MDTCYSLSGSLVTLFAGGFLYWLGGKVWKPLFVDIIGARLIGLWERVRGK